MRVCKPGRRETAEKGSRGEVGSWGTVRLLSRHETMSLFCILHERFMRVLFPEFVLITLTYCKWAL